MGQREIDESFAKIKAGLEYRDALEQERMKKARAERFELGQGLLAACVLMWLVAIVILIPAGLAWCVYWDRMVTLFLWSSAGLAALSSLPLIGGAVVCFLNR